MTRLSIKYRVTKKDASVSVDKQQYLYYSTYTIISLRHATIFMRVSIISIIARV